MMKDDKFDFSKWINDAFLDVTKKALNVVAKHQSTFAHSFYITFISSHKDVKISEDLLRKHPKIMTIVIENQFSDLEVLEHGFSVSLSFESKPSKLYIPWQALLAFIEKNSNFQMVFQHTSSFLEAAIKEQEDVKDNLQETTKKDSVKSKAVVKTPTKPKKDTKNVIDFFPSKK